jgi:hypothetical protein
MRYLSLMLLLAACAPEGPVPHMQMYGSYGISDSEDGSTDSDVGPDSEEDGSTDSDVDSKEPDTEENDAWQEPNPCPHLGPGYGPLMTVTLDWEVSNGTEQHDMTLAMEAFEYLPYMSDLPPTRTWEYQSQEFIRLGYGTAFNGGSPGAPEYTSWGAFYSEDVTTQPGHETMGFCQWDTPFNNTKDLYESVEDWDLEKHYRVIRVGAIHTTCKDSRSTDEHSVSTAKATITITTAAGSTAHTWNSLPGTARCIWKVLMPMGIIHPCGDSLLTDSGTQPVPLEGTW